MMNKRVLIAGLMVVAPVLVFAALGWWSNNGATSGAGMHEGELQGCASAPNCVCSEARYADDTGHFTPALELPVGNADEQWRVVRESVVAMGGTIVSERENYLHATVTSATFRFVDDVELRRDGKLWHVRSSSRVGYSDMGANSKRVAALKSRVLEALSNR
jgi:uncharacterized protein (DUF1499 family)